LPTLGTPQRGKEHPGGSEKPSDQPPDHGLEGGGIKPFPYTNWGNPGPLSENEVERKKRINPQEQKSERKPHGGDSKPQRKSWGEKKSETTGQTIIGYNSGGGERPPREKKD